MHSSVHSQWQVNVGLLIKTTFSASPKTSINNSEAKRSAAEKDSCNNTESYIAQALKNLSSADTDRSFKKAMCCILVSLHFQIANKS